MKWLAGGLLAGAAGLTALAFAMRGQHIAWGYMAAFSEAAMVGAMADWFAVVALFKHPLGLRIPHTAIIPSNKDRIGENLATFICANFLSNTQVLDKLQRFGVAERVATWLSAPAHARQVADHLGSLLHHGLNLLDDPAVQHFFRNAVLERLGRVDSSRLAGELLDMLTTDGRHERLLDGALRQLAELLNDPTLKAEVAEVIASEVKYLRFVGLDNVAGRYATEKMVAGVVRLVGEMGEDAAHPMRVRFDAFLVDFIHRLKDDPEVRRKGKTLQQEVLAHPQLAAYLQGLWSDLIGWTRSDLGHPDSTLRAKVTLATQAIGQQLQADDGMRGWINSQLMDAAPRLIERYREDIRQYIIARVGEWNAEEMTAELERNIGRDLQFIRINGTMVGGLVGLAIHALKELIA
ncbi:MAG: hypothetical protein RLZZ618_2733 [Pseudomonadota bacterium]